MTKEYNLQVEAIKDGTVIDHIPANIGFKVMKLFSLQEINQRVTVGFNLRSSALGTKDLIKIENIFINEEQAKRLALYAPKATVNQIEHYQVVAKLPLTLPTSIEGLFHCPNTNCITHYENAVENSFSVIEKADDIHLKCKYCEKVFSQEIMTEKN